jgi:hypothetical protein
MVRTYLCLLLYLPQAADTPAMDLDENVVLKDDSGINPDFLRYFNMFSLLFHLGHFSSVHPSFFAL